MDLPPEQRLGIDIKRAEHALIRAKTAALRPADLTVAQYAALMALKDSPGISGAALARACLVTPQAMTSVLKLLHERGLVERRRHPWHQHVLETHLTESGRVAVTTADEAAIRIEARIRDALSPTERATLRELLDRCVEAIEAEPADT